MKTKTFITILLVLGACYLVYAYLYKKYPFKKKDDGKKEPDIKPSGTGVSIGTSTNYSGMSNSSSGSGLGSLVGKEVVVVDNLAYLRDSSGAIVKWTHDDNTYVASTYHQKPKEFRRYKVSNSGGKTIINAGEKFIVEGEIGDMVQIYNSGHYTKKSNVKPI